MKPDVWIECAEHRGKVGIGIVARQQYPPSLWCSSNRLKECSVFTIGRILIDQLQVAAAVAVAFAAAVAAIAEG